MSEVLHYRPHYHRDWKSSTTVQMMSLAARTIFSELLDWQWEEGFLPGDIDRMRIALRYTDDEWAEFLPFADRCFPIGDDGLRRNDRLDSERRRVESLRENGKKGGRPKKKAVPENQNHNQTPNQNGNQNHNLNHNLNETISKSESYSSLRKEETPFAIAESVLGSVAEKLRLPPPTREEILKHLKPSSPIQRLVKRFGVNDTADLVAYARSEKSHMTLVQIENQADALMMAMRGSLSGIEKAMRRLEA